MRLLNVLAAAFALVLLLTSCATAPPRDLSRTAPPGSYLHGGGIPLNPEEQDPYSHRGGLVAVLEERHGRPLQILELSGGGQYGAFGAGFLNGWTEQRGRPRFDIVTGISTGALLSTFAFLGTPADDATLAEIFTGVSQKDIYRRRLVDALFGGASSFYNTQAFEALIAKHITPAVLQRVAAEHDKGRRLLVGATNLDYGDMWVFDLGHIAKQGGPEALALYRKALRASASPPIVFPPVEISGSLFGDGGVTQNLLVAGLLGSGSAIEYAENVEPGNVFVIQNGRSDSEPVAVQAEVIKIGERTVDLVLNGSMDMTLMRAFGATRIHGYRFNLVSIPDEFSISGDTLGFDQTEMRRVFDEGKRLGRQADPWQHKPPAHGLGPWAIKLISHLDRLAELVNEQAENQAASR